MIAILVHLYILSAASATAAAPEFLLQIPSESTATGPGAGELANPRGMATNPVSGHVYIANRVNVRVDEFTVWGNFVRAWGWDVAPDGAPGDSAGDEFEICTVTCKQGNPGGGVGQFSFFWGVAVDTQANIYVYESPLSGTTGFRVQKFDSAGNFLLAFGGAVNEGPNNPGDLCTAQHVSEGDSCGPGVLGTGDGEFSNSLARNYIAFNLVSNTIFVGDVDRIQEFNLDGTFKDKIELGGAFDGKTVEALAADPASGDLYVSFASTPDVYRLDRTLGTFDESTDALDVLPVNAAKALAVDVEGSVYVARGAGLTDQEVIGFDSAGNPIPGLEAGDGFPAEEAASAGVNGLATRAECPLGQEGDSEAGDLYVDFFSGSQSYAKAFGPPPTCWEPPPLNPPQIKAQYAVSAETKAAVVKAQINPMFWPGATYYVEYGTGECASGGCPLKRPLPPGEILTTKSVNAPVTTAGVFLPDLQPHTTYQFRFVAQSDGGGPVFGIDPDGKGGGSEASFEAGLEGTFMTFPEEDSPDSCSGNEQFRVGPSRLLPDCRVYELVSPLEKNNADILTQLSISSFPTSVSQSADSGGRFTFSSSTPFADPDGAPVVSQYLANRIAGQGWVSEALTSAQTRPLVPELWSDNEFRAFSSDLCSAWLRSEFDPPLSKDAIPNYRNLYRRENCNGGIYETLTTVAPPHIVPKVTRSYEGLQFQGAAVADPRHAIFVAPDNLPGTVAPANTDERLQLYERTADGQLHFVCILPNASPTTQPCYAGTADSETGGIDRSGSLHNAISADGERIFWTESGLKTGVGKIFARVAGEPGSRRVSQAISGAKARFWGAAADGSRAIVAIEDAGFPGQNENLYSVDVDSEVETLIAEGVKGVLGLSEDATRVYFASTKALPGSGANSEEDSAVPGEPNIYMWEEVPGTVRFVGTLADGDMDQASTPIAKDPFFRLSRVTADGLHAAFMSTASLTGYDNTDAVNGEADAEVFLYDAPENELRCVSCIPSGARPTGILRLSIVTKESPLPAKLWQAAQIPTWEKPFYASRVLSDDGNRLFFESWEALVPHDTNAVRDVYQWEAPGSASCDEGDSNFGQESGGCVELISSGESPRESIFLDADPTGSNVFFSTLSSLIPPDYGLVDIYDARVNGGFDYPDPPPSCEGAACQSPPPPPAEQVPASETFHGTGNVQSKPSGRRCRKGKRRIVRRGKVRCVKRAKGKGKKRTQQHNGRGRR